MNVPEGASGSSTTRARLCVPGGGLVHCSGVDMPWPSQVYWRGMFAPSLKAVLERVKPRIGSPFWAGVWGVGAAVGATGPQLLSGARAARSNRTRHAICLYIMPVISKVVPRGEPNGEVRGPDRAGAG